MERDDGSKFAADVLSAEANCKPTVCTTTSELGRLDWRGHCGQEYRDAPVFTMIREPVLRVYTFYKFMQSWYQPYRELTLDEVMEATGNRDLNKGLPKDDRCRGCEAQLSNALTLHYFCAIGESQCQRLQKDGGTPLDMAIALDSAKELMSSKLSAIFLERQNRGFMANFNAMPALLPAEKAEQQCRFRSFQLEPTLQTYSLSDKTIGLITQKNAVDMALYSYAVQSMENVVRDP